MKGGSEPRPRSRTRTWALLAGYVGVYVALDRLSYVFPVEPFAITPWNPPAGVSIAFLLVAGLRFAPALLVAALLADVFVRWGGVGLGFSLLSSLVIAICYTGVVAFLLKVARVDASLRKLRDVGWLVTTAVPASLAVAAAYVGLHAAAGLLPRSELATAILRFWIGDMIGIVVTTPAILAFLPGRRSFVAPRPRATLEAAAQVAATVGALALVLRVGAPDESRLFYLLFPPIIWIALRNGLRGTALATLAVQVVLIVTLHLRAYPAERVLEFQFLMLSLAFVGLFLGITVTERIRAQDELARSESELRTLFDTAPDGIVTLDGAGRVTSANPAAARIAGLRAADLVGEPVTSIVPAFPRLPTDLEDAELVAVRPDGGRVSLEVSVAVAPGTGLHIALLRNVAGRRAAEEKLREKQEELTGVLRFAAAGQVASSLAHELNQPLYALSTYVQSCQILASRPDGDRALLSELMEKSVHEVARAGEVVKRLREFFQTGATRLEAIPVRALVESAAEATRRRRERHRIELAMECAEDAGELRCDSVQLEIVLLNLVGNAIDAIVAGDAPQRQIRLSARRRGDQVDLRVEDSGPGIAEEMLDRLFEPFHTTKPEGMGLGLAIARYIVEAHGGRLWAERLAPGTAFCVTLPTGATAVEMNA